MLVGFPARGNTSTRPLATLLPTGSSASSHTQEHTPAHVCSANTNIPLCPQAQTCMNILHTHKQPQSACTGIHAHFTECMCVRLSSFCMCNYPNAQSNCRKVCQCCGAVWHMVRGRKSQISRSVWCFPSAKCIINFSDSLSLHLETLLTVEHNGRNSAPHQSFKTKELVSQQGFSLCLGSRSDQSSGSDFSRHIFLQWSGPF